MNLKRKSLFLALILSLLSSTIINVYAYTQLIKNPYLFSTSYWHTEVLTWGEPLDPAEISEIQDGYWHGVTIDSENWDYSDSFAGQGKIPQGGGNYWETSLNSEPILPYNVEDNTLKLQIRFKVPYVPIWMCPYNPFTGFSNSFSVVAVVFFEVKVEDNQGNVYWTDYTAPDDGNPYTPPEFVAVEKFNRWFYEKYLDAWYQADENHLAANFLTLQTTHDTVPHNIRAGWILDEMDTYQTFTWDVSRDFRNLCTWIKAQGNLPYIILEGRVKAVMISVEGYCAKGEGYIDYVILSYYG